MNRKAFEAEARKHGLILDRLDKSGVYVQLITEQAWNIWQATIAAALATPATAPEPVAWLAHYVGRSGMEQEYVSTDKTLADENDASGKALPLYLHPPATAPAQPEIVDLLAEMYELILANKVVLAEKSGGVWTWPDRAIEAVRKHRSGPARAQADHKKSV